MDRCSYVSSSTLFDNRTEYPFTVSKSDCFGAAIEEFRKRKAARISTRKRKPNAPLAAPIGTVITCTNIMQMHQYSPSTVTSTTLFDNKHAYRYTITKTSLFHSKNNSKQNQGLRVNAIAANNWIEFVNYYKKQNIPYDDECMHESVDIMHKQIRCGDELESCFIICKLCGKTERK